MPNSPPLRVGLLLDSPQQPAWVKSVLEQIQNSSYAKLSLVVMNGSSAVNPNRGLRSFAERCSRILPAIYTRLDRKFFRARPDAFEPCDLRDLLGELPSLTLHPLQKRYDDVFSSADAEAVREYDVDVLFRLGFRVIKGPLLSAARCGIWSFHHGDNRTHRGGAAGFWEVVEREPTTGCILQILNDDLDNGLVLSRANCATDPTSVNRNRNILYWKSMKMLPMQLKKLHRLGSEKFLSQAKQSNPPLRIYDRPLIKFPTNLTSTTKLVRHGFRMLNYFVRNRTICNHWQLRFSLRPNDDSPRRYRAIVPPRDRFWADPHVIKRDGKYYVFVEEMPRREKNGFISVLEIDARGNWQPPRPVLVRPYHLSYPFVFEFEGTDYMIPETSANKTIELYRCVRFPEEWVLDRVLMPDVNAVDTTLLQHEDHWWMFTMLTNFPQYNNWEELHLFHADSPLSTAWTPHPANPIVFDARRARPAGPIMNMEGNLFRPAQDCSRDYGYAVRFQQIETLTTEEYREHEVEVMEPKWDKKLNKTHTFCRLGDFTILDSAKPIFQFKR